MNRFLVRLSAAFVGVSVLVALIVFSLSFWVSVAPEPSEAIVETYLQDVTNQIAPAVEALIIEGHSDAEIVALLDNTQEVEQLLEDARAAGFAEGVNIADQSFGRIFSDYLTELFNQNLISTILIGSLLGIIASVFIGRWLVNPLTQLTKASQALGESDLSQRVSVQGSDEINELAATFNKMAAQLEENETIRQNMLADISHELRTPLAGLEGSLRATLDGVFEMDSARVGNLYEQTRHLSGMVNDLHLLARADAKRLPLNKTSVDLVRMLTQTAEIFGVLADDAEVTLSTSFEAVPPVLADELRLRQVVSNLLNNALRHTPSGGTIELALRQVGDHAEMMVKDSGEGISAEHLPHLFDRFYRADKSRDRETGGTGLGLAITRALVVSHDGEISAESAGKNKGACFRIKLPLHKLT